MDAPPAGSRLSLTREGPNEVLLVPQPSRGVVPYLVSAFLILWLVGWAVGFKAAAVHLLTNPGNNALLALWLAGWTVGGAFALFFLYRLLRPSVAETYTLRQGHILYDSGVPPFQPAFNYMRHKDMSKALFHKRVVRELTAHDLRTLKLRETDSGNRLTVDKDSVRLDLATTASEIEREWLHAFLSRRYS